MISILCDRLLYIRDFRRSRLVHCLVHSANLVRESQYLRIFSAKVGSSLGGPVEDPPGPGAAIRHKFRPSSSKELMRLLPESNNGKCYAGLSIGGFEVLLSCLCLGPHYCRWL
jgi:hypothetical protein